MGMRAGFLFLMAWAAGLAACTLPNPARSPDLPPSPLRVTSQSTAFRLYHYPIHGVSQPAGIAKLDAYHHGLDDIVVSDPASSQVILFKNLGNGTFRQIASFASCSGGDSIDGEDISGDGYDDFIVNCSNESVMSLFLGDGHGGFTRHDIKVGPGALGAQVASHVNQPGTPYLSVLHDSPAQLELLTNLGDGNFVRGRVLPAPASPSQFAADIFTRDGSISYAVLSGAFSKLSIFLNNGNNYSRRDYPAPEAASAMSTSDLTGQGISDLIVASGSQSFFRLYLNDGHGGFGVTKDYQLPEGPAGSIGTSHLRGAPQPEIIFQSSTTGDIIIFPNLGNGHLQTPESIHAGAALAGLITGHFFHHDDDMDVALLDTLRGELVILLNEKPDFK